MRSFHKLSEFFEQRAEVCTTDIPEIPFPPDQLDSYVKRFEFLVRRGLVEQVKSLIDQIEQEIPEVGKIYPDTPCSDFMDLRIADVLDNNGYGDARSLTYLDLDKTPIRGLGTVYIEETKKAQELVRKHMKSWESARV